MQTFANLKTRSGLTNHTRAGGVINQQVRNILRAGVQPKLKIGAVNDPAEAEADRVADQVMRMPARASETPIIATGQTLGRVQRKCTDCNEDDVKRKPAPQIRMKSSGGQGGGAPASAEASSAINSLGGGAPLPASERAFFEPRFGRDLSGIRIHTGNTADGASQAISARAFSLGNNIAFAKGEYKPGTPSGRRLMAHEITHTLQGGSGVNRVVRRDMCDRKDYSAMPETPIELKDTKTLLSDLEFLSDFMDGGAVTTIDQYCAIRELTDELAKRKALPDKWKKVVRPGKKDGWEYEEKSGRWAKGHAEFRKENMTKEQRARGDEFYGKINGHNYTQYERGCVGVTNAFLNFKGDSFINTDCFLTESQSLTKAKKKTCNKGESVKIYAIRYWDTKKAGRKPAKDGKYPVEWSEVRKAKPKSKFINFDFGFRQADGSYIHANHAYLPGKPKDENMKVKISPTYRQYDNGYAGFNTVVYCIRCGKDD